MATLGDELDRAMVRFARACARTDQTEADHAAVARGELPVEHDA